MSKYKRVEFRTPEQHERYKAAQRRKDKRRRERDKLGIEPQGQKVLTPEQVEARRLRKNAKAKVYANEVWNNNRLGQLFKAAKTRAEKKGLEFTIEPTDLVIPEVCPVYGTPLDQPSFDRVDNTRGYVKGNVCVISRRANTIKHDSDIEDMYRRLEELQRIITYMENNIKRPG